MATPRPLPLPFGLVGLVVLVVLVVVVGSAGCDPFRTQFDDLEQAEPYHADVLTPATPTGRSIKVMTWNVKFGAGRIDFFFDCHGDRGWMDADEVYDNLAGLAGHIRSVAPDVLIVNEVEVSSRRSAYIDQVQYLLDHTDLNHGAYASIWRADYVPSDGIGKIDMGNAILSRWPVVDAERIALPLIGEQDGLTQYFYLKRNLLRARVDLPGATDVIVVATHTAAFASDGTKKKHIDRFLAELDAARQDAADIGAVVLGGGDLNTLPPGTAKFVDFPDTVCTGERFEADDYGEELDWLSGLYDAYTPAIALDLYQADNAPHFTHTTDKDGLWNRKLDYLFSDARLSAGRTHQETLALSDHAPVSATLHLQQAAP